MNKKILATSLLSACAFAGLAVGGTYALFTSNAEANIAIQTATVKYEATVRAESLKTYSLGVEQAAGAFENGGTAALSGNTLTLNNVTPGDKAEVEIKIVNTSTVKTAYRVVIRNQGDGKLPFNVTGEAASWVELAPSTNPSENVKVGVELPTTVGDDYQGKSYALKIAIEAVQANGVASVDSAEALTAAVKESKTVVMTNDIELTEMFDITESPKIDLGGHTLTLPAASAVADGASVEFSNGTLAYAENSDKNLLEVVGGSLTVDNVDFDLKDATNLSRVPFMVTGGVLNIKNVDVESNRYYAVTTNNAQSDAAYTINIEDSTLTASNTELDNDTVLSNCSYLSRLNIKHSIIKGQRQAVFVRTGVATIEDSTLISTGEYLNVEKNVTTNETRLSGTWSSGNEAPAAALVVGDANAEAYNLPATVTLKNTSIVAENGAKKVVIASDGIYPATIKSDAASLANEDVTKIGTEAKITVEIAA